MNYHDGVFASIGSTARPGRTRLGWMATTCRNEQSSFFTVGSKSTGMCVHVDPRERRADTDCQDDAVATSTCKSLPNKAKLKLSSRW